MRVFERMSLMKSSPAISWLVLPAEISRSTSTSRGVRPSGVDRSGFELPEEPGYTSFQGLHAQPVCNFQSLVQQRFRPAAVFRTAFLDEGFGPVEPGPGQLRQKPLFAAQIVAFGKDA